jgi:hypothetical protein
MMVVDWTFSNEVGCVSSSRGLVPAVDCFVPFEGARVFFLGVVVLILFFTVPFWSVSKINNGVLFKIHSIFFF